MDNIKIKEITDNPAINIAIDTIEHNKQALVFCSTRSSSESTAEKIASLIKTENPDLEKLSNEILKVLSTPTKQCKRLAACVKKGTAFHHAGLASGQRKIIEDSFRKGVIKIICATPTLCLSENSKIWHGMNETEIKKVSSRNSLFVLSKGNKVIGMKALKIDKNFNEHDLIRITSVSGYSITLTPNHEILVKKNSKKQTILAGDCTKSDKIATIGKINLTKTSTPSVKDFVSENLVPFENIPFTEDFFYLIGAMLGDGYSGAERKNGKIIYKGSPTIVGEDKEIFDSIIDVCNKNRISYNFSKNYYGTPQLVLTKSYWFREFLCNCGVDKGINKHINQKLMNGKSEEVKCLLQGLFDTDGFVQKGISAVGFCNTSITLIKNVQKLLLRFGIVAIIREKKASTMKIYNKEYATKICYELLILNKRCLQIFNKEINFRVARKREALHNLILKYEANINYFECKKCNYRLYYDLFSGRAKNQKGWGLKKLKIIETLGKKGELKSNELMKIVGFLPRHKTGNRLNHHYYLISKKRFGNREWIWSLNPIGKVFYNYIIKEKKSYESFFTENNSCPLCGEKFNNVLKKGWRDSDFDGDIFWDKIKKIETVPKEESEFVYDVVLSNNRENRHFFIADGFFVHNSYGVNMPAFRSIIKDLKRYGGRWGMEYIPTLEYHQMAGRAGRPDFNDEYGEAICIAQSEKDAEDIVERYINAPPEKIYSKMAVEPVLRTYCLSLIATGFSKSKEELVSFFRKTFYAKQYGDMQKLEQILFRILGSLEEWEFIVTKGGPGKKDDFVSANELGIEKLEATKLGERVAQLYIDPYTAHEIIISLRRATQKITNEVSFLHLAANTLELRPLPTVRVREVDKIEPMISEFSPDFIVLEPSVFDPDYDEFLKSVKLTLALRDWMDEKNEEDILEGYNIAPGELHLKRDLADWVLYAAEEIALLMSFQEQVKMIRKTRFRLDKGIKEELVPLARLEGIGRIRARTMFRNGIKDVGDIKNVDVSVLSQLLGRQIAINLKKQVGIDVEKEIVPKGKRKGQTSIEKY